MAWQPDYVTLELLKQFLRIEVTDTSDDWLIAYWITSASRSIDDHCNRQFGFSAAPEQRTYKAALDYTTGRYEVTTDDFQATGALAVEIGGVAVTDFELDPPNAVADGKAYTGLRLGTGVNVDLDENVLVTNVFGWSVTLTPTPIKQAAFLQASRFAARRESPYGVAGSPDAGNELRLLSRVDADVAVSLRGYRRRRKLG